MGKQTKRRRWGRWAVGGVSFHELHPLRRTATRVQRFRELSGRVGTEWGETFQYVALVSPEETPLDSLTGSRLDNSELVRTELHPVDDSVGKFEHCTDQAATREAPAGRPKTARER